MAKNLIQAIRVGCCLVLVGTIAVGVVGCGIGGASPTRPPRSVAAPSTSDSSAAKLVASRFISAVVSGDTRAARRLGVSAEDGATLTLERRAMTGREATGAVQAAKLAQAQELAEKLPSFPQVTFVVEEMTVRYGDRVARFEPTAAIRVVKRGRTWLVDSIMVSRP